MHNVDLDLTIGVESLSKIEGHAELEVKVNRGEVIDAKLVIDENRRFFSDAVMGKPALAVPQTVSRICGTCSVAHLLASIDAVESAFELKPSEQTINMRKLLMHGTYVRDHAMHLYLFCLPDYMGKESILDFEESQHGLVHKAFEVKAAGNLLATIIGGRPVHPPLPTVGGFLKTPADAEVKQAMAELKKARQSALEFIDIFAATESSFKSETDFVALTNEDYDYVDGEICGTEGGCILETAFDHYLEKVVIPYSQSRGFTYEGKPYMVGALARMNGNKRHLARRTRKDVGRHLSRFPSFDVFDNNLAQAIEIVHGIDASLALLEAIELRPEAPKKPQPKKGLGIGVVEAPRGLLYYKMMTGNEGKIEYVNLVIPTAQNQVKMEKDMGALVQEKLDKGVEKAEIKKQMEMLIRAFDPCMSCATNFLKVRWSGK
ncbi:Sulfhydrogenase 1 subunit alpha [uncultured archaeon]|nr:Sulfhydrogenase 1 subunit alpha [uncultured archaeon]